MPASTSASVVGSTKAISTPGIAKPHVPNRLSDHSGPLKLITGAAMSERVKQWVNDYLSETHHGWENIILSTLNKVIDILDTTATMLQLHTCFSKSVALQDIDADVSEEL